MRALPPRPAIFTAVPAFQRRASARFLRRPRTGKIATSVTTRVYAEKAVQRNDRSGYVRRSSGEPFAHSLNSDPHAARFFADDSGCANLNPDDEVRRVSPLN